MNHHIFRPCWALSVGLLLAGCGGGGGGGAGGSTPAAAPSPEPPSFRTLAIPSGFQPGTASIKSVRANSGALLTAGELPGGYGDASLYTWVTFTYADINGETRTLAVLRWTAFAALGTSGVPFELPSHVTRLSYVVYNANGAKSGSLPV